MHRNPSQSLAFNDKEIHSSIRKFILYAEKKISSMVCQYNYESLIIKKDIRYGVSSDFIFHGLDSTFQVISYSITYVILEDVELNYGERPNDICLSIVWLKNEDTKKNKITRDVTSELEDIDYCDYNYSKDTFEKFSTSLEVMIEDFTQLFTNFVKEINRNQV